MKKNILILGAARSGKTTLARKIAKEYNYNIISIDDIIRGFEAFPELYIRHDYNDEKVAKNFFPFLKLYLKELAEGPIFYNDCKYVIEGTHIDFEKLIPYMQEAGLIDKYEIIGLTYNYIDEKELYENIKKHDTEDDWTYWSDEETLKGDVKYFIDRNKFFNENFIKYNITNFDASENREQVLEEICNSLFSDQKRSKV